MFGLGKKNNEMQYQEQYPQMPPPETNVELQTTLVTPDSQKTFNHINRDMTLSNLSDWEVNQVRIHEDIIGLCDKFGFNTARDVFQHDVAVILNSSRGRRGFERKMVSTFINRFGKEEEPKRKPMF